VFEIECVKNTDNDGVQVIHYIVGPLNLDRLAKRATTVMGEALSLNADEFAALDILASREDEPLTFELLYEAIWRADNNACELEARHRLGNLLRKVSEAGAGFMWIEYEPETGYTFRTRWGHNWQTRKSSSYSNPLLLPHKGSKELLKRVRTLTPAETTVLYHLVNGYGYHQAASQMYVTVNTLRLHINRIMHKLGVHAQNEFMAYADLFKNNDLESDSLCAAM